MTAATSIPLTVTPEASEYIDQLGMRSEFEQMLEHTRQTVPGLRAISVELDPDPSNTIGSVIVIWVHRDEPTPGYDPVDVEWGRWKISTFSPEVSMQFAVLSLYDGATNGR